MEKEVTQEQLIEAVKNAKTKQDLRVAAYNLARHNDAGNHADHDRMVEIMGQLRNHVNATPAPAFPVPFSVRLIALMGQDLGPGWRIFVSARAWASVIGDSDIHVCLDPTVKYSQLLAGQIGVLYGTEVLTDAYYHPELQVLEPGCMYVMSRDGSKGYAVRLA